MYGFRLPAAFPSASFAAGAPAGRGPPASLAWGGHAPENVVEMFGVRSDRGGGEGDRRRGRRSGQPRSRMTMPATMRRIPAISRTVERSRKKKYEAMKVKTSSTCPTART